MSIDMVEIVYKKCHICLELVSIEDMKIIHNCCCGATEVEVCEACKLEFGENCEELNGYQEDSK